MKTVVTLVVSLSLIGTQVQAKSPAEVERLESSSAGAEASDDQAPVDEDRLFQLHMPSDLSLSLSGIFIGIAPKLLGGDLGRDLSLRNLNPAELNGMDRSVLGNHSPSAAMASDVTLAASVVLPFLASSLDYWLVGKDRGLEGFAQDALILTEAVAVNLTVCTLTKFMVRRPRPYMYQTGFDSTATEDSLSFFSGHTSLSFTMATAYSYLFSQRHPDSWAVVPVWLGSHALAASTAFLRVEAGKHFWSDVLVGAAVGSAIGFAVPYLHTRDPDDSEPFLGLAQVMATPSFYQDGFGITLTALW